MDLHLATVNMARIYLGVHESGANAGDIIEGFQKTVDGVAQGEPWCAAFVCTVLQKVAEQSGLDHIQFSEHCLTLWNRNKLYQRKEASPGRIIIWKRTDDSGRGHAGIVETSPDRKGNFLTVEGNVNPSGLDSDGDGVYRVKRNLKGFPRFSIVGFLDPWVARKT